MKVSSAGVEVRRKRVRVWASDHRGGRWRMRRYDTTLVFAQDHANITQTQPDIPTAPEPSPTEPNTPESTISAPLSDRPNFHSSVERTSFSSLINYDASSQPQQTSSTQNLILTTTTTSRVEMLKLRLRVAMYKVRTNQINIPFDRLKVQGEEPPRRAQTTPEAVEEAVAQLRREAQAQLDRDRERAAQRQLLNGKRLTHQTYPKLLPAPILKPTAYSSRMLMYDSALPSSSPPVVSGSPGKPMAGQMGTAARSPVKGRHAEGSVGLRDAKA